MIRIDEVLEVPAPPGVAWALLSDPDAVAQLVPGATLDARNDDGSYDATLKVKFGPAKVAMKARLTLELDAALRQGRVVSRGKDSQGGVRFETRMHFAVTEMGEGSRSLVDIRSEVELSGRLANVIEAGAQVVAKRMASEFSEQLSTHLEARSGRVIAESDALAQDEAMSQVPLTEPSRAQRVLDSLPASFARLVKKRPSA